MDARRRTKVVCRHINSRPTEVAAGVNSQAVASHPALNRRLESSYDYIIVGAGSSGCVLASRLSEDPSVSVLLVEAGGSNQKFAVRSPFLTCPNLQNSDLDWAYRTTPQATMDGRVSNWPRGKCLGGCSSINYMQYVRGDPRNYDDWAQRQGCAGWSYKEVLPFFKKSENLIGATSSEREFHGVGGPLNITKMGEHDFATKETCERFLAACEAAGLPRTDDYNGECQRGASIPQHTVKDGVRQDVASTFLFGTGALSRPNLTVLTHAAVTRLAIQNKKAVGIYVSRETSPPSLVNASREVVVSCGAVGTAQLLMLSGIGPQSHLAEVGIDCHSDLPVGENLQDHLFWPMIFPTKPGKTTGLNVDRPLTGGVLPEVVKHLLFGTGTFSFPWLQATAFDHSHVPGSSDEEGNDIQFHVLGFAGGSPPEILKKNLGFEPREDRQMMLAKPLGSITILPTLLLPKSVGTIRLASADPNQYPVIDPKYFTNPRDMQVAVAASRLCAQIAREAPLQEVLDKTYVQETSNPHPPDSDAYLEEHIRRYALTVYHPVGTAKMGAGDDNTAVVDPRLRVRGIQNLRVADASIMPTIVSANTNAPCIMIGERAAAFIQEDFAQ